MLKLCLEDSPIGLYISVYHQDIHCSRPDPAGPACTLHVQDQHEHDTGAQQALLHSPASRSM